MVRAAPPSSSSSVRIRRAAPADAPALAALGASTFSETFGHLYAPEDLEAFIATVHACEAWQHTLVDPQRAVWLAELADGGADAIADGGADTSADTSADTDASARGTPGAPHANSRGQSGAHAIGFIAVGPCKLPLAQREPMAGEVQQLYVLARHQNRRIGGDLMDQGLQWLESQGFAPLYIGVWSQNQGAQRFYRRYGFSQVGEYGFPVGKTLDREFILRRIAPALPAGAPGASGSGQRATAQRDP